MARPLSLAVLHDTASRCFNPFTRNTKNSGSAPSMAKVTALSIETIDVAGGGGGKVGGELAAVEMKVEEEQEWELRQQATTSIDMGQAPWRSGT